MSKRKKYEASIDWNNQPSQEIIFPICLRSPAVHGRRLVKSLEAVSDIPKVHVILCDLLDRHNFSGLSPDPKASALAAANEWLDTNMPALNGIVPQHDLTRWQTIQDHPNFPKRLKAVTEAYNRGSEVRSLIDGMAGYYINRKADRLGKIGHELDVAQERHRSTNYLLEEMAGDMTYAEIFPNAPRVYWGLSVDDTGIFKRNLPDIGCSRDFPRTAPITLSRTAPSVAASELYQRPALAV